MGEQKILVEFVIEMLGRPAEYLKESMEKLIENIDKIEGVKIKNKKIHEPKKLENAELFSIFVEIEAEFDKLLLLVGIIFTYMPSNIEIIKPKELVLNGYDLAMVLNELTRKLHQYDEIAKKLTIDYQIMQKKLMEMQQAGQADKTNVVKEEKVTKEIKGKSKAKNGKKTKKK